jgi:flagellar biosynthesis/type III secretory pathway protein FliH
VVKSKSHSSQPQAYAQIYQQAYPQAYPQIYQPAYPQAYPQIYQQAYQQAYPQTQYLRSKLKQLTEEFDLNTQVLSNLAK